MATPTLTRPTTVTSAPPADPRRWYTLAVLSLSLLVIVVDTTIVNVAIPTLAASLHAGASALEWIVDSYTLAFAALLLPAGSLGDRFGRHRALALGMGIFGAASLGAALSSTATQLILWRVVMGVGAAVATPATMAILTAVFTDPRERAKAIGIWSAVSGLGVAIGPTAGGWLLQHYSWNAIFLVNLPIVAVALVATIFLVPASKAAHPVRFDIPGAVLAAAAFGAVTYAVIEAGSTGWTTLEALVRFAAGIALLAAFIGWEAHTDHPMVDLTLFRNPRFSAASSAIMILFFGLAGMTFVLTQIYQFVLGYSPLEAGIRSLPAALAITVTAPLGTRLAGRFGTKAVVTGGLLTMAAGLAFFSTANGHTTYAHYMLAAVAMAGGIGLTMAPATDSIMAALPREKAGIGSAVNNATRNLGTVLGVAVVGSIAANAYTHTMAAGPAAQSIGAAAAITRHLPPAAAHTLHTTTAHAFVTAADLGVLAATALALLGAAVTTRYLPHRH